MDFLGKEMVGTFYYTDMSQNREGAKMDKVDGRDMYRLGTYQAVTMVGNLYEYYDPIVEHHRRFVMVGMAKQHPCDLTIDKNTGFEVANENAHVNPCIVMAVDDCFDADNFAMMCEAYANFAVCRKFVKTAKEIHKSKTSCIA